MIHDVATLRLPLTLRADLCVIGSGAGGSGVAMIAAEAGLKVVVLEAGAFLTPADMSQREDEMFPRLYWDGAGRTTTNRAVKVHQGRGVGGSTLHNLNLCKRIPGSLRERWRVERGLQALDSATWDALYAEVERLLTVAPILQEQASRQNSLLDAGCRALGWRGGPLPHNRTNCQGLGSCEVGCPFDSKNSAAKVLLPRAVRAGAEILSGCQAVRVEHGNGVVRAVEAVALSAEEHRPLGRVRVEAPRVCLSASATATPALLRRSRVPDPGGETGMCLRVHPGAAVAGDFDEPVNGWKGIPQTWECTELLDFEREDGHRAWIVPSFAHPIGAATLLPGHGEEHRRVMQRYAHLAAFSVMLHDRTAGRVAPDGDLGLAIEYWPDAADRRELALGLEACGRLLFAAGARRIYLPASPMRVFDRDRDLSAVAQLDISPGLLDITAVHPMASVPMGDNPQVAAVDSRGKHHHMGGLWLADGSLFPSSIGVPPQLSIYALGLHVGRALVAAG